MNWKKGLGIGLVFVGFYILLTASAITGAVIGGGKENLLGWVGVICVIVGILIIFSSGENLEWRASHRDTISIPEFFERVKRKESDKRKRALVLDTSVILEYSPKFVEEAAKNNEDTYVTDSVIDEVHNNEKKGLLEKKTFNVEGFEKYRNVSKRYLERTEKPTLKRELLPYINGEKQIETLGERVRINKMAERVRVIMAQEKYGIDLEVATQVPDYALSKVKEYLENECEVTEADVDVLSTAIKLAKDRVHAIIGERDIDLRQAVELIKGEHKKLGDYIDFVEVYEKEYITPQEKIEKYRKDALVRKRAYRQKARQS